MEDENRCRTCLCMVKSNLAELTDDIYEFLAKDLGIKSVPKQHPELQLPQILCSNCNRMIMEFQRFLTKCRHVETYFNAKLELLNPNDKDMESNDYKEYICIDPIDDINTLDSEGDILDSEGDINDDDSIFEISSVDYDSIKHEIEEEEHPKPNPPAKNKIRSKNCSVCGRHFRSFCQLRDHENIHKGIKPYCCDICGKCFTQKSTLGTHQKLHTGKKVECEECGKKFARSSELILHDRVHRDEKPFVCDVKDCKAAFRLRPRLLEHQAKHTGERKFRCDICGHAFFSASNLCGHKNKVHPKFSYQCDLCFSWFSKPIGIRKHMDSKHKIQLENLQHLKKPRNVEQNISSLPAAEDADYE